MSWNIRILLGLVGLLILAAIIFGIYYTVVRLGYDGPIEVATYPGAAKAVEETVSPGFDHLQFTSTADPIAIEQFYRQEGYTCRYGEGNVFEHGVLVQDVYIRSDCLLDRSHFLGFHQTVKIVIQPVRSPYTFPNDDRNQDLTGGGVLTGQDVIDVQRTWGTDPVLGG